MFTIGVCALLSFTYASASAFASSLSGSTGQLAQSASSPVRNCHTAGSFIAASLAFSANGPAAIPPLPPLSYTRTARRFQPPNRTASTGSPYSRNAFHAVRTFGGI